jgi:hypothetical protein
MSLEKAKALWRGIGSKDVLRRIMGDKFSEMETLIPEKTPIVLGSPRRPSEPRTHSSSALPPTLHIDPRCVQIFQQVHEANSFGGYHPGHSDTTQKKRSEEKVIEMTDRRAPPRFP